MCVLGRMGWAHGDGVGGCHVEVLELDDVSGVMFVCVCERESVCVCVKETERESVGWLGRSSHGNCKAASF